MLTHYSGYEHALRLALLSTITRLCNDTSDDAKLCESGLPTAVVAAWRDLLRLLPQASDTRAHELTDESTAMGGAVLAIGAMNDACAQSLRSAGIGTLLLNLLGVARR
eukprot:41405-Eustigmatos_ZCMA.PRE.1